MVGNLKNQAQSMFATIGAIQTLIEQFPMNLIPIGSFKFNTSFDILIILFKILGVDREEVIDIVTKTLTGKKKKVGGGFIDVVEEIVKKALEANIINILNCTTNPIIPDNLMDKYIETGGYDIADNGKTDIAYVECEGSGITIDIAELDLTSVLVRNPLTEINNPFFDNGSKFYFDVEGYTANNLYKSMDFNAFLWYIINKSNPSAESLPNDYKKRVWDNRFNLSEGSAKQEKELIRCEYIDEDYPFADKIKVHICGARRDNLGVLKPANYCRTRNLKHADDATIKLNKTILEFNHDFINSLKLYDSKVIVAEFVEALLGNSNLTVNLGFSINEEIIKGKIQQIIRNVITIDDTEVVDCYYTFSNEEYNEMLEASERNRYNALNPTGGYGDKDPNEILSNLTAITQDSTLHTDEVAIKKTLTDLTVMPNQTSDTNPLFDVDFGLQYTLLQTLAYPFVRPLFTPKVMFLLLLNQKIMGSYEDAKKIDMNAMLDALMSTMFVIIRNIVRQIKDLLVEMLLEVVMKKIKPMVALYIARLLLETLTMYKDLLLDILKCFFWFKRNKSGDINDINDMTGLGYVDIVQEQTEPEQVIC